MDTTNIVSTRMTEELFPKECIYSQIRFMEYWPSG